MKRFTGFALTVAVLSCQVLDDSSDVHTDPADHSVDEGNADPTPQPTVGTAGSRGKPVGEATIPGAGRGATPGNDGPGGDEELPPSSEPDSDDDASNGVSTGNEAEGEAGSAAAPDPNDGAGGTSSDGDPAPSGGTLGIAGSSSSSGASMASGGKAVASGGKASGGAPNAAGTSGGGAASSGGKPASSAGSAGKPGSAGAPSQCTSVVTEHGVTGAEHVAVCTPMKYETNPPCEGTHYDSAAAFTTYDEPIPHGFVVHSLEHGGIAVWYNCPGGCPAEVARAQAWIDALPEDVLCVTDGIPRRIMMVPNPELPTRWAASAWGWTLTAPCFDEAAFTAFYKKRYNKTSEKYCRGSQITSKTCPGVK